MSDLIYSICSRSLTQIGGNPISSFDDGTAEADVAREHYEPTLLGALTLPGGKPYRWRFASDMRSLGAPLEGQPTGSWSKAWALPGDLLSLTGAYVNGYKIPYAVYGNKLLCDESQGVIVEGIFRPTEELLPEYFLMGFRIELASIFVNGLNQDSAEANRLMNEARNAYMGARTLDSQQQPPKRVVPGRLARIGRSRRGLAG